MLTEAQAAAHPAYNDSLRTATRRAAESPGACFTVYFDGAAIYVRTSEAAAPPHAMRVCIVQRWDDKTVQLRFTGARSEWVKL
jgi:hypothetical protein